MFTTNTVLNTYQGNPDGTVYASAGSGFFGDAPNFDVTSTTLDVTISGGMRFASGNSIDLADSSVGDQLGEFPNSAPVTFTPVDSTSASVPFEFSPTLGVLAVGSIWGLSRLRKRAVASKITEDISA